MKPLPEPWYVAKQLKKRCLNHIDGNPSDRYNTSSVTKDVERQDAHRLYPPEAEGHWRKT